MKKVIAVIVLLVLSLLVLWIGVDYKNKVQVQTENDIGEKKEEILKEAEKLKQSYYVDEAIEMLNSEPSIMDNDIKEKIQEYTSYKESFVKYEGDVEHIFFHSLMVYTNLAFDNNGHDANGYNMWFVTNEEFKRCLPLLKERGFVIVKITDIYSKDESGNITQKDIYLPQGKKPLIISQDDVNYYEYMKPDGFADRLVIDDNGEVATAVRNEKDETIITRDGDMVPILDDFIKENPEFSYKGAKGILAVTGYEGVFGYRLNSEENKNEAKEVANRLKETGWLIASHSYTHNDKGFFQGNMEYTNLLYDFTKWKNEIEPIVGDTDIFISPFGVTLENENFNLVKQFGFDIYCNVSRLPENETNNNIILTPRFNIDGYSFFNCQESINKRFFDVSKVIDARRPVLKVEN